MGSLKIGADPEVFLEKDGKIVSAYGLIPGTKSDPFPVEHGGVQVDGMAAEFNIDPVVTSRDFSYSINQVLRQLRAMVPEYNLAVTCANVFDHSYFESQPIESKLLGCDPDFNAYTMSMNEGPDVQSTLRTVAGHVHLGWTEGVDPYTPEHFEKCAEVAKQLDYFLGLPSLVLDSTPESAMRRSMYGKAGTFRPKHYGMEYRTLSNFWIFDDKLQELVFNQVKAAWEAPSYYEQYADVARVAIDANNVKLANVWMKTYAPQFLL